MKKKNPEDPNSTLTLKLEEDILKDIEKIKIISLEKTSAGAIRFAIKNLLEEREKVDNLTIENANLKESFRKITNAYITLTEKTNT